MGFFNRYFPGPGPGWPYTDLHQINLDWIIYEVKTLGHNVEEYKTQLDEMGVSIEEFRDYIENIDQEIQQHVETQVPIAIQHEIDTGGFNTLLSASHKRRIVFIGDSYADGWTPDGTFQNWAVKVANILGLTNSDYVKVSMGGAGFRIPSSDPTRYIPSLINSAYANIQNPETVTDVIFGLGYNDYLSSDDLSTIKGGIETSITVSKQKFPNARNHIFGIGFTTNREVQKKLIQVYKAYQTANANYDFHNISDSLIHISNFSTDGIHPLENGQNIIAINIVRILNGGTSYNYTGNIASNELTYTMKIGDSQDISSLTYLAKDSENGIRLGTIGQFKIVNLGETGANLSGNTKIKMAELKNCPYTGIYFPDTYCWDDAILYYRIFGDDNFYFTNCSITLAMDSDNKVYLWLMINGATGSGFVGIQNMKEFGIQGLNMKLPFITKVY